LSFFKISVENSKKINKKRTKKKFYEAWLPRSLPAGIQVPAQPGTKGAWNQDVKISESDMDASLGWGVSPSVTIIPTQERHQVSGTFRHFSGVLWARISHFHDAV